MLGGDRFYTVTRWLIVILLFASSPLIANEPIWPPFVLTSRLNILIWAYLLFSVVLPLALWFRPSATLRGIAFAVDSTVISLLTYRSHNSADLFYPLYLLPLIGAAIQLPRFAGLWIGLFTAFAYLIGFLLGIGPEDFRPRDLRLEMVALMLRSLALVFIPWLVNELIVRSAATNQESVVEATRASEHAISEANTYRDQMRSLYEVAFTLSSTMNYQSVLDVALSESRKLVSYTRGLVLLSTGHEDELYIAASYGLRDDEQRLHLPVGQGAIDRALRTGDPVLIANVTEETELEAVGSLAGCKAGCIVPLRAALRTYGAMLIASEDAQAFTQEQLGMLTALANYAIVALHNAQLIHDLREERTKLISKEEEVRRQLARDLHDGPAQALAAITMNVEFLKRLLERDPDRVPAELDKMGQLAKRTTHEVRTMLFELRPLVLETQGLDATLKQYFDRLKSNGTALVLETDNLTVELDTKTEGTLFNIIQESVNNALKHAHAKHIWVHVRQTPTMLETTIRDDGDGFDITKMRASYEQRGSFGLLNIEERAKLIGGFAEIESSPGEGTRIRVVVPLTSSR